MILSNTLKTGSSVRLTLWFALVSAQQVEVDSGAESVQLPFETTADLPEDTLVVWWCDEPEPAKKVHEHGTESDQHEVYRGRTRMREDPLNTGIFTLTLNRPAVRDAGTYACRVYGAGLIFLREKTFQLTVKGQSLTLGLSLVVCLCLTLFCILRREATGRR